jgi:hypothetical protein
VEHHRQQHLLSDRGHHQADVLHCGGDPVLGFALQDQAGQFILSSRVPEGTTQRWETENCADDCATTASGTFTLTQLSDAPAVIPLPATAALLPLGIGALALMRRRRTKR